MAAWEKKYINTVSIYQSSARGYYYHTLANWNIHAFFCISFTTLMVWRAVLSEPREWLVLAGRGSVLLNFQTDILLLQAAENFTHCTCDLHLFTSNTGLKGSHQWVRGQPISGEGVQRFSYIPYLITPNILHWFQWKWELGSPPRSIWPAKRHIV